MTTVLKTTNLCKTYGEKTVTDNVSLNINEGTIYGLIGKNGAGKTTLMRQILGMALPSSGKIELFDGMNLFEARKHIGSLIEAPAIYKKCTAYENMYRMAILLGSTKKEVKDILEFVGLGDTGKNWQVSSLWECVKGLE